MNNFQEKTELFAQIVKFEFDKKSAVNPEYFEKYIKKFEPVTSLFLHKTRWAHSTWFQIEPAVAFNEHIHYTWFVLNDKIPTKYFG